MRYPLFTTDIVMIVASMLQLGKPASLPYEDAEQHYTYGKVVSPLAVEDINTDYPENEGTFHITYQFPIGELLSTEENVLILQLLTEKVCERSEMVQLYCDAVLDDVEGMLENRQLAVDDLNRLLGQTEVHLPLTNTMKGNATSNYLEMLKEKEEFFSDQVRTTVEKAIAEIMENDLDDDYVIELAYVARDRLFWQQHTRTLFIEDIRTSCQKNVLPTQIVSLEAFGSDLNQVWRKLNDSGLELAVPTDKIFVLPLVKCVVKDDHLQVTVDLPVRQKGKRWTVKAIPFIFNEKKCKILPFDEITIAVNKLDKILVASEVTGQNRSEAQKEHACLLGILNNLLISELKQVCQFSCSKDESISTIRLEGSKHLVTGGKRLNIRCGNNEKEIPLPHFGSLEIEMSSYIDCNITLFGNNETLKLENFCDNCSAKVKEGFPEMVHVIPSQWTHFPDLYDGAQQRFISLSTVLNNDWDKIIPIKNKTSKTENKIK